MVGCAQPLQQSSGGQPSGGDTGSVAGQRQRPLVNGRPGAQDQAEAKALFDSAARLQGSSAIAVAERALQTGKAQLLAEWPQIAGSQLAINAVTEVTNQIARPVQKIMSALVLQASQATSQQTTQVQSLGQNLGDGVITIAPGAVASFTMKGHCLDPELGAPNKGDALYLVPVSNKIPAELVPLYNAVGAWATTTRNDFLVQQVVWAITEAGTDSMWARAPSNAVFQAMDQAMPGGADAFRQYHGRKIAINSLMKNVLAQTGLNRYIKPEDILGGDPTKAANRALQSLITKGESVQGGKGTGYSMLAPNVAARGIGDGPLKGAYQVLNASDSPFVYRSMDYAAAPEAVKQTVSSTTDLQALSIKDASTKRVENPVGVLQSLMNDLKSFLGNPTFAGAFSWMDKPLRAGLVIDRAMNKVRELDRTYPIKAIVSGSPVAGNLMALYETASGKDWLYGTDLSVADRALAAFSTIPGENTLLASVRYLSKKGKLGIASKNVIAQTVGQKAVSIADKIVDRVYFDSRYKMLQPIAARMRTEVENRKWENWQSGNDRVPFQIYDDPNSPISWLADKVFSLDTRTRDLFTSIGDEIQRIDLSEI